jgi:glycosyltransferase involved in cell wall biosynthesis
MAVRKRVVYILQSTSFGGAEQMTLDVLKAVDYQKCAVCLVSVEDILSPRISRLGLPVECIPSPPRRGPLNRLGSWAGRHNGSRRQVFAAWVRFLTQLRPDKIILGNAFYNFSFSEVLAASRAARGDLYMIENSVPFEPPGRSSRLHFGFVPGVGLWWYKVTLPLRARGYVVRGILAASEGVKQRAVSWGYPSEKVWVTRHGIDTSRFAPATQEASRRLRTTFGMPEHARVIVSTARLSTEKRVDRLIKAFDGLAPAHDSLWLLLIGDGPLKNQVADLVASSSYRHRIRFLGHFDDVVPALQASDIYVLPSESESLGLALLEAMASQLVCVATRTIGPTEIIEPDKNGLLVDISSEGVLEGLRKALGLNAHERSVIGRRARRTVLERFRVDDAVRRKLALLGIDHVDPRACPAPSISAIEPAAADCSE